MIQLETANILQGRGNVLRGTCILHTCTLSKMTFQHIRLACSPGDFLAQNFLNHSHLQPRFSFLLGKFGLCRLLRFSLIRFLWFFRKFSAFCWLLGFGLVIFGFFLREFRILNWLLRFAAIQFLWLFRKFTLFCWFLRFGLIEFLGFFLREFRILSWLLQTESE